MSRVLETLLDINEKFPEPLQEFNRKIYRRSLALPRLISMSVDRENRAKWKRLVEYIHRKPGQWLLLCTPQIGDTLLTCGLAKSFEETHRPSNIKVLISPHLKVLASYFPSIEQGTLIEVPEDLIPKCWGIPMPGCKFRPDLLPGMPTRTSHEGLQGTHGILGVSLLDVLKFEMYLPHSAKLQKPLPIPRKELNAARDILAREKLPTHKTVILSPMARGMKPFRMEWWRQLAKLIEGKGLVVVWNLPKDVEPQGLRVLYPPLNLLRAVSYLTGNVVSMRSGFCDLLALDNLNLIVLYPKGEKVHLGDGLAGGSIRNFFSLKAIWESESAVELELCRKEMDARLSHTFTPILDTL